MSEPSEHAHLPTGSCLKTRTHSRLQEVQTPLFIYLFSVHIAATPDCAPPPTATRGRAAYVCGPTILFSPGSKLKLSLHFFLFLHMFKFISTEDTPHFLFFLNLEATEGEAGVLAGETLVRLVVVVSWWAERS